MVPVKLDKNQIPDFKHIGVIHVDQMGSISASNTIIVHLTAWSTWTGVPHLPEIVLHTPWKNTTLLHSEIGKSQAKDIRKLKKTINFTIII